MSHPRILVAIPCYNCAPQIPRVINGFDKKLLDRVEKVMIIDNQSTQPTIAEAAKAIEALGEGKEKFEIFRNDNNYNLGGSHKVAFLRALEEGYDYVAILHGDDQAKTQELHELIDQAEQHPEVDAILGTRFMIGSRLQGYSLVRILGNVGLNWLFSLITLRSTKDLGSGLNLFKMSTLADKRFLGFINTLTFNIDLLLDYYKKKAKLIWWPISWSETDQVSNAKAIQIGLNALRQLGLWRVGTREKQIQDELKKQASYTSTKKFPA